MSFFDSAYDAMSWNEVCYRLPSELSVNALKRRVTNLDTMVMFFDNVGGQGAINVKPLKDHVNELIAATSLDDLFAAFGEDKQPVLFNWMTAANKERFKSYDKSKLSLKFLFNLTNSKDAETLTAIMDKVLGEAELNTGHVRAVLSKTDDSIVAPLLSKLAVDKRPEVRAMLLSVPGSNADKVSEMQKVIGLKALAKCATSPITAVNMLSMGAFANLRPKERLVALERYLDCFPLYHKMAAFSPAPLEEELKMLLFAGCIEQNDLVVKLMERYKQITEAEEPEEKEEV